MKRIIVLLGLLLMTSMLLVSCIDYKAAGDEELVDSELVDLEVEMGDEVLDETELEESESDATEDLVEEEEVVVEEQEVVASEDLVTIEADESEFVDLGAVVVDPDDDEVTYYFSAPVDKSGEWQTNYGDAGDYVVTLTASDTVHTVTQDILLRINRVNVAPQISELGDLSYSEGDEIVFEVIAIDPNGDSVEVEISEPLASGLFETDHTSSGVYEIVVKADDGELSSESVFTLTIEDVNVLPVISGFEDLTVKEGDTIELDLSVEDLDGDSISLTISDPVGQDGVWELSFTDNGEYEVTITADDGKDIVTETINIVVEDVNMPPQIIDINLERN